MSTYSSLSEETHGFLLRWLLPLACVALFAVALLLVAGLGTVLYMAIRSALNVWNDSLDELMFEAEELLDV